MYNASLPFTDGYQNVSYYYSMSDESAHPLIKNSADALLAFQKAIINVISSYITTSTVKIDGTVYDKSNILKNIQVTLLLKGVTYNEITSGNVDNMISLFYGDNSQTNNLMPINNLSSKNSWNVYGFYPVYSNGLSGSQGYYWSGTGNITQELSKIFTSFLRINIYTSYTGQEYYNALVKRYDEQKNKIIVNTVNNLILNEIHEQINEYIPNHGIIINGVILTKEDLITYTNNIGWSWTDIPPYTMPYYYSGCGITGVTSYYPNSSGYYPAGYEIYYSSPINNSPEGLSISPYGDAFNICFHSLNK